MPAILLDTHIALWLKSGDERLRLETRTFIDDHWKSNGEILLSSVSVWEIALLVDGQRIELDCSVEAWVDSLVQRPGFQAVPLSFGAAAGAYRLHHLDHRDPADRLLIATAIELACPFVTYDARIQAFADKHGSQYGFRVSA